MSSRSEHAMPPSGRRRGRIAVAAAAMALGMVVAGTVPASGDAISDKKAEAARIAARVDALQEKAAGLDEDVNDAQVRLAQVQDQIAQVRSQIQQNAAALEATRVRMGALAVKAYVNASSTDPTLALISGASALDLAGIQGYADIAVGRDANLTDELRQRRQDADAAAAELKVREDEAASIERELESQRAAADAAASEAEDLLAKTNADLRDLIAQEAARQAELARKAAEAARKAAEEAARKAAAAKQAKARQSAPVASSPGSDKSTSTTTPGPRAGRNVPPPSPGASGAIAAAQSQLGVPYRRNSSDPGVGFDCSGLTSWAWAQAGRSIPHSSRAQYASLTHVDRADLQPGDLVFFGSPIHHVGLYVGGGQMIHAPQTGRTVTYASISRSDFVGAARP